MIGKQVLAFGKSEKSELINIGIFAASSGGRKGRRHIGRFTPIGRDHMYGFTEHLYFGKNLIPWCESVSQYTAVTVEWFEVQTSNYLVSPHYIHACSNPMHYMSLVTRKTVFGVFDQVSLKPACSDTETC